MTLEDGRESCSTARSDGTWTTERQPRHRGHPGRAAENSTGDVLVTAIDEEAASPPVVIHEKPAGQRGSPASW